MLPAGIELEIIKLARSITSPLSLAALAVLLLYLLARAIVAIASRQETRPAPASVADPKRRIKRLLVGRPYQPGPRPILLSIFDRFWILALVIVLGAGITYAIAGVTHDKLIRGTVLFSDTKLVAPGVLVSVAGYAQRNWTTGQDGNFEILIPARDRAEEYILHAETKREADQFVAEGALKDEENRIVRLLLGAVPGSASSSSTSTSPPNQAPPASAIHQGTRGAGSPAVAGTGGNVTIQVNQPQPTQKKPEPPKKTEVPKK